MIVTQFKDMILGLGVFTQMKIMLVVFMCTPTTDSATFGMLAQLTNPDPNALQFRVFSPRVKLKS